MKKYTIDLNNLSMHKDPITYLYSLLGFDKIKKVTLKTFHKSLIELNEDMYIEFLQFGLISDSMMELVNLFETVEDETDHLHLSRSLC